MSPCEKTESGWVIRVHTSLLSKKPQNIWTASSRWQEAVSRIHTVLIQTTQLPVPAEPNVEKETQAVKHLFGDSIESTGDMVLKGRTRPGSHRGHEHFGYKDGVSQPALR
jgi:hypothetical protein